MHKVRIISFILAILLGGFLFVYGEYDDSPGAQLLGAVLALFGIVSLIRGRKKELH